MKTDEDDIRNPRRNRRRFDPEKENEEQVIYYGVLVIFAIMFFSCFNSLLSGFGVNRAPPPTSCWYYVIAIVVVGGLSLTAYQKGYLGKILSSNADEAPDSAETNGLSLQMTERIPNETPNNTGFWVLVVVGLCMLCCSAVFVYCYYSRRFNNVRGDQNIHDMRVMRVISTQSVVLVPIGDADAIEGTVGGSRCLLTD